MTSGVRRDHRTAVLFGAMLLLVASAYYSWTWSRELGDFGGDNAVYLLTARHYTPWAATSEAAEHATRQSAYPPVFPLVLAVFGGADDLLLAHLITTTMWLGAFVCLYFWLCSLGFTAAFSAALALSVALLPGVYLEALSIHSEGAYLLATLLAFLALARAERSGQVSWHVIAAGAVAAATLTRNAGVALLAAYVTGVFWNRGPRRAWLVGVAGLPWALWHISRATGEGDGDLAQFAERYGAAGVRGLGLQLGTQVDSLWHGWAGLLGATDLASAVAAVLLISGVLGLVGRIRERQVDGLYGAAYLGLIVVWPFPAEAPRLLAVIAPPLLVQAAWVWVRLSSGPRPGRRKNWVWGVPASLLLAAGPTTLTNVHRMLLPLPSALNEYRQVADWYTLPPDAGREALATYAAITAHLRTVGDRVPPRECIFAIKPSIVAYYTDRIGMAPPDEALDEAAFDAALRKQGCRFFYLVGFGSPTYSTAWYPAARIPGMLRVDSAATMSTGEAPRTVGILAERLATGTQ